MFVKFGNRMDRKRWLELGMLTVVFCFAAILVYRTTILYRMVRPRMETQVETNGKDYYQVLDKDHIEQTFVYPSDELLSVGTRIKLNENAVQDLVANENNRDLGILHVNILDSEGTSIMRADYDVCDLDDGQNVIASFPGSKMGWAGKELTIVIDVERLNERVELAISWNTDGVENTSLTINGKKSSYAFNIRTASYQFFYWRKWAFYGAVLVYILVAGTYLGLAVFRLKPENMFLFTGLMLAVLYLLLMPPMSVPDEHDHYKKAYSYVNALIGEAPENERNMVIELEDLHALWKFLPTPSLTEYDILRHEIWKTGREEGTEEIGMIDTQAKAITYLPGMIGIFAGRLAGLSGIQTIYLGRLIAIGFYLFMMYWFIRLMPFAKAAAFIIAILPMTIQQCCSYSYDAVVIEMAFLYLAVLFGLLYREQPIRRYQVILYTFFMVILSVSKGGTYMPLCLLTMMIPAERFKNKKQKWGFVGCMAFVAIAAFFISTLGYVMYVADPSAQAAAGAYLAGETYGVAGLLKNPVKFFTMMLRTLFLSGDGYLETMLGMQLGWLDIFVSRIVIYGLLLLMILAILPVEDGRNQNHVVVKPEQKVFYLAVLACSIMMAFAAMFMSWTPEAAITIEGIQGRYFLPALPAVLLVFHSQNIVLKKNISRACMFLAVSMQCIAIYGILLSLEEVL